MERRMAILKKVEPILESAIKILTQVIDVKTLIPPKPKPQEDPPPQDPPSYSDPLAALGLSGLSLPSQQPSPQFDLSALLSQVTKSASPTPDDST